MNEKNLRIGRYSAKIALFLQPTSITTPLFLIKARLTLLFFQIFKLIVLCLKSIVLFIRK